MPKKVDWEHIMYQDMLGLWYDRVAGSTFEADPPRSWSLLYVDTNPSMMKLFFGVCRIRREVGLSRSYFPYGFVPA